MSNKREETYEENVVICWRNLFVAVESDTLQFETLKKMGVVLPPNRLNAHISQTAWAISTKFAQNKSFFDTSYDSV